MAATERERAARADGDVLHTDLVPLVGGVVAGAAAIGAIAPPAVDALRALLVRGVGGELEAGVALRAVATVLGRGAGGVTLATALGALVAGLIQTRGWFGRPGADAARISARPAPWLALLGWLTLLAVGAYAGASVLVLHPAPASAVGDAALVLVRRVAWVAIGALVVLAALDHLVQRRARASRLGLDDRDTRPRPAPSTIEAAIRGEALLAGARWVVFDTRRALVLGLRDGQVFVTARVEGAEVDALCTAARKRGLPPRLVVDLSDADRIATDAALSNQQLAAWGISV